MERSRINDDRMAHFGGDPERWVALVCECGDADCWRAVALKRGAFTALRHEGRPILFAGHRPVERSSGQDAGSTAMVA
jgi:hypothetical protein